MAAIDPAALHTLSEVLGSPDAFLPLTWVISEQIGVARSCWPVALPVALPRTLAPAGHRLRVEEQGQAIPSQLQVLTSWDDGSAQYAIVHAVVNIAAHATIHLQLAAVTDDDDHQAVAVEESGDAITVDTGAARFTVARQGGVQLTSVRHQAGEFIAEGGQAGCFAGWICDAARGGVWVDPSDDRYCETVETRLIERGPARCVIEKRVQFFSGASDVLRTWLIFYRDQPWVRFYSWYEAGDYLYPPTVSREVAFDASLRWAGGAWSLAESRFGTVSEEEVVHLETPAGEAAVVLPWLRELGMEGPANVWGQADPSRQRVRVQWRPIDSADLTRSPMNAPCWVPRYWREAALAVGTAAHPAAAQAIRAELEMRGLHIRPQRGYQPAAALLDRLVLLERDRSMLRQTADAVLGAYLSPDYPRDGIDGSEMRNWESAYFHGFGWRTICADQPRAFCPRRTKPDGVDVLLTAHAFFDDPESLRRAKLQARAWPVNCAPAAMQRYAFTFDDTEGWTGRRQRRGEYSPEAAHLVPYTTNPAYAAHLLATMFWMWTQTGEPMLRDTFDRLLDRLDRYYDDPIWRNRPFDGDRPWIYLRDLVRLYQLTEQPRYRRRAEALARLLPERVSPEAWIGNRYVRLWNVEAYALCYRLTGSEKVRRVHERLIADDVAEAQQHGREGSLLLPIARGFPAELEFVPALFQLAVAVAQQRLWDDRPEARELLGRLWQEGSAHFRSDSPYWPGLQLLIYSHHARQCLQHCSHEEVLDRTTWDLDSLAINILPGELLRLLTLTARRQAPYRYDAATRCLTLEMVVPNDEPLHLTWPSGWCRLGWEGDQLHLSGHLDDGQLRVRITDDGRSTWTPADGLQPADSAFEVQCRKPGAFALICGRRSAQPRMEAPAS
ncbi:MAG TPA: hypothetical protein VF184_02830 [Phycisphaeraceae bacterium]